MKIRDNYNSGEQVPSRSLILADNSLDYAVNEAKAVSEILGVSVCEPTKETFITKCNNVDYPFH